MQARPVQLVTLPSLYEALFKEARKALGGSGDDDVAVQVWLSYLFGSHEWGARALEATAFMATQTPEETARTPLIVDALIKSLVVLLTDSIDTTAPSLYGTKTLAAAARRAIEVGVASLETAERGRGRRWPQDGSPSQRLVGWLIFSWERNLPAAAAAAPGAAPPRAAVGGDGAVGGGSSDAAVSERLRKLERALGDAQNYMGDVRNNYSKTRLVVMELADRLQNVEKLAQYALDEAQDVIEFVNERAAAAQPPSSPAAAVALPGSPLPQAPPPTAGTLAVTELLFGELIDGLSWAQILQAEPLRDYKRILGKNARIQNDIVAFLLSQPASTYVRSSMGRTSPLRQALEDLNQEPNLFFGHVLPVDLGPSTVADALELSQRIERELLSQATPEELQKIRGKPHVAYNDAINWAGRHLDLYRRARLVAGVAGQAKALLEPEIEVVRREGVLYAMPNGSVRFLYSIYFAATKGDVAKSLRRANALVIALTIELMRTLRAVWKIEKAAQAGAPAMQPSSCHATSSSSTTTTTTSEDSDVTLPPSEAIPPRQKYYDSAFSEVQPALPPPAAEQPPAAVQPPATVQSPAVVQLPAAAAAATPLAPSAQEYAAMRVGDRQRAVEDRMRFAKMALSRENEQLLQVQTKWLRPVLEWRRANPQRGDEQALLSDREQLAKILRDFIQTKTGKASEKRAEIERIALSLDV